MNGYHHTISGDARSEVTALLAQMRSAARDPARVLMLSDQLEVFAMAHLVPQVSELPVSNLTRLQTRMLSRLWEARGALVTRDQLMNAMYFDRPGDEPDAKIIDVLMCKLRAKLSKTRYSVETLHGHGFKLKEKPASGEPAGLHVRDFLLV